MTLSIGLFKLNHFPMFHLFSLPLDDLSIPASEHFQVDWTLGPSVLVIGGETTGLGEIIKDLACQYHGQLVRVPMANTIDCLSAAMAGTVIIYEAYRQLLIAEQDR